MREGTMNRQKWVGGSRLLLSLLKDDLAIAKAIRAQSFDDLHGAALIANEGVSPSVAMSDPALFKALREATTLFFLKGYACLNTEKLASLSSDSSQQS